MKKVINKQNIDTAWQIIAELTTVCWLIVFTITLFTNSKTADHILLVCTFVFVAELIVLFFRRKSTKLFFKENWLNILMVIPFFRILRVSRYARFAKLAKVHRTAKLLNAGRFAKKSTRALKLRNKLKKAGPNTGTDITQT